MEMYQLKTGEQYKSKTTKKGVHVRVCLCVFVCAL